MVNAPTNSLAHEHLCSCGERRACDVMICRAIAFRACWACRVRGTAEDVAHAVGAVAGRTA